MRLKEIFEKVIPSEAKKKDELSLVLLSRVHLFPEIKNRWANYIRVLGSTYSMPKASATPAKVHLPS